MPRIEIPDDELAVLIAAIRGVIEGDKYPRAPRLDPLRAALARLDAAAASEPVPLAKGAPAKGEKRARGHPDILRDKPDR